MPPTTSEPLRDTFDADGRGLQHNGLRKANERAVLTVIGFNAGVSNAEISRLSGLAPQTVSAILTELDRAGLISRGEVLRGRRGQPATPISLHREGAFAIGVEIGWRHLEVLLLNLQGEVLTRQVRAHAYPDASTICDDIATMVDTVRQSLPEALQARLVDIGIAMPSNIADNLGLVHAPPEQRALWLKTDIVAALAQRTQLEATLFNDGNAACWAQLIAAPRPRPSNFIYFLISRSIAAGIFGQGTLWEGPSGKSASLGSMLVSDADGLLQPAHLIASVTALEARLTKAGHAVDANHIDNWDWQAVGPLLDQWVTDSARALARVVYNTTTVLESGLVVLDSILPAEITAQLVERLGDELRHLPVSAYQPPQVQAGHLGENAPAIGAAMLVLYRRFFSRTLADLAS